MEGPVKLLTNGVNKNGITRFGKLIHSFCPERHGKTDEQHSFNQVNGKFQVGRDAAGHAFVIGHGMAATMITDEDIQKEDQPPDEESAHEPVTKLEDVIDLVAVLGGIWRLPHELINQGQLIHTGTNLLRSTDRTALSACERGATDEN